MLLHLFTAALWSPAGKGLTSWLSFVMFNCVLVTFPWGILGQVRYLIVSIPDLCQLSYFKMAVQFFKAASSFPNFYMVQMLFPQIYTGILRKVGKSLLK